MAKFLYLRIPTQNSRLKAQSSGLSGLGIGFIGGSKNPATKVFLQ
jgi:hypothetical protein